MSVAEELKNEDGEQWRWPEGLYYVRYPPGFRATLGKGAKGEKEFALWECIAKYAGTGPITWPSQATIQQDTAITPRMQTYYADKLCDTHDDEGRAYLGIVPWATPKNVQRSNVYVLYPFVGTVTDEHIRSARHDWGQRYRPGVKYNPSPELDIVEEAALVLAEAAEARHSKYTEEQTQFLLANPKLAEAQVLWDKRQKQVAQMDAYQEANPYSYAKSWDDDELF